MRVRHCLVYLVLLVLSLHAVDSPRALAAPPTTD